MHTEAPLQYSVLVPDSSFLPMESPGGTHMQRAGPYSNPTQAPAGILGSTGAVSSGSLTTCLFLCLSNKIREGRRRGRETPESHSALFAS